MKITDKRATHAPRYRHDGAEVVLFNPPLTMEEWDHLLVCQEKAEKYDAEHAGFDKGEEPEDLGMVSEAPTPAEILQLASKGDKGDKDKKVKQGKGPTKSKKR